MIFQLSKKYFILGLCWLFISSGLFAQRGQKWNMEEHDLKPYYFGLNFGYNQAAFRLSHNAQFGTTDTFTNIQARWGSGFHLGLMGSLRLTRFIDLRFLPTLLFANKPIYTMTRDLEETRNIESIYMHLPWQLKFKSDRVGNFRFYGLAGLKFDYDLSANARSRRTDEFIKIKPFDLGGEIGIGFDFFFPNFIFTPEIKISQGIMNAHYKDPELKLSNALDQMRTRMFVISIMLQG